MRILMLGWEFPPFIAGGLGTACYGLTRALDRLGHEVVFVLPRVVDRSSATHIELRTPADAGPLPPGLSLGAWERLGAPAGFRHMSLYAVYAGFAAPYTPGGGHVGVAGAPVHAGAGRAQGAPPGSFTTGPLAQHEPGQVVAPSGPAYGGDLVADAERYTRLVVSIALREHFDVIHAHDWLTFPAGAAVAVLTGRPLVIHVHSTEFDRSGEHVNQRVYEIERAGMLAADRVLCVSRLTRTFCERRYGVPAEKLEVVYNGIESDGIEPPRPREIASRDKIVLFLGRITMQKGPEYFIAAAKRVLEKMDNVKFVVAGAGDMAVRMIELAAAMGIGHKVLFTGFLRGRDVDRVFRLADCYVMPSVSEPFGLVALEAIRNDVPVIISKQSGVSEVLSHVLKVDFWDTDEMANKILAVLRLPPLGQTLREHGPIELRGLSWEGAAVRCVAAYDAAVHARRR